MAGMKRARTWLKRMRSTKPKIRPQLHVRTDQIGPSPAVISPQTNSITTYPSRQTYTDTLASDQGTPLSGHTERWVDDVFSAQFGIEIERRRSDSQTREAVVIDDDGKPWRLSVLEEAEREDELKNAVAAKMLGVPAKKKNFRWSTAQTQRIEELADIPAEISNLHLNDTRDPDDWEAAVQPVVQV